MALFSLKASSLESIDETTFEAEGVMERTDIQAALRDRIEVLGDDLCVIAEEFGPFEDANRRIDLLCVDRKANLVVIEIKRTQSGGHMELQALRYAAMVSTMTFDDVLRTHREHCQTARPDSEDPD